MSTEYVSVMCAALLHDICRFLPQRCAGSETRQKVSEAFVSENAASFANPSLVQFLVSRHSRGDMSEGNHSNSTQDARRRMLAHLVAAAVDLAEGKPVGESGSYQYLMPMDSVFSQVDLGTEPGDTRRHKLSVLFNGDLYPQPAGSDELYDEREYQEHCNRFVTEFQHLFSSPYEHMADTLTYLLQKYLWCVPSDTARSARDISLAEHMKVSAALAACFFRYHESCGWNESAVRDRMTPRAYLLCGDLSGIQNFIYGIANVGTGGVAKRLRGRSFRISMLTDAVALRILRALDLPLACKIMSAGGQFYLLIPNTEADRNKASDTIRNISDWLLKAFSGEIALSTGGCGLAGDNLSQRGFGNALLQARNGLALRKQRKFADVLGTDQAILPLDYHGRQACAVCNRRPADLAPDGEVAECEDCRTDRELGQQLVSERAWLVLSEQQAKGSVQLFESPAWFATLVTDPERVASMSPIAAFNLRGSELLPGVPSGYQLHAGYVPRWRNTEDLATQPDSLPDKADLKDRPQAVASGQAIKSFEALAASSTGVKLLGVMRSDVDHLGLIFTLGMENRTSLSRIATMSSMLHYFFTYELQKILENEFPDVYTAYAGGDDLMLIGPWDQSIELAKRIADEFGRYTAGNPNITISTGIGTYKPKAPIATTSRQTGELLERSKSAGRNRLTVFDTTMEWKDFEAVREWKDSLREAMVGADESRRLSRGFLYKLLEYQRQAREYELGNEQSVMYRPHLAYNLGRNMTDKDGNPTISADLHERLCLLVAPESKETWRLLKAPITWCTYLLREERQDE